MTLWHGRFEGGPAGDLLAYTESLSFDRALAGDDITGSRAHVRGLVRAELLDGDEASAILGALDAVEAELADGSFVTVESDEDIHTAIERRVTELAGEAGAKLHTGRSRNDQVATAFRLFLKRELAAMAERVLELQAVLEQRATDAGDAYLPGYTHLQRAQPVLLAHHLLAHGWALARDVDRLLDARRRLDVSPLGAGALAGSSLPLDPSGVAADLGFASYFENSLDATSDRDFVAEALFALTMTGLHLSRLGEEVVLWCSQEFGFLQLDDAYATGSSMLPQKKNPDVAELARGKAGRLVGNLTGLLTTLKGLPLAYNRDLQEDKEPVFDALAQLSLALAAMTGLLATATFDTDRMADGSRRPGRRGHRPGRAARAGRDTVPDGARHRRRARAPLARGCRSRRRWRRWSWPTTDSTRRPRHCSDPERSWPAGRRPVVEDRCPVAQQLKRFGERLATDRARVAEAGAP